MISFLVIKCFTLQIYRVVIENPIRGGVKYVNAQKKLPFSRTKQAVGCSACVHFVSAKVTNGAEGDK